MIKKLVSSWLIQLFCVLWAAFLFLDYINYSGYFLESFQHFEYTGLLITILIAVTAIAYFLSDRKKIGIELEIKNFRSIYHYLFLLLFMGLIMTFYLSKTGVATNPGSAVIIFIFRTIAFHLGLAFIFYSAFNIGYYLLGLLPISPDKSSSILLGTAIGFFVITIGLFILGALGLLYIFVVIPFLIVLMIPGWKSSFTIIRQTLTKKSETFRIHSLAVLAYAFLILLIAITLTFDMRTMPLGYDGIGLYMNVPKLIAGYHGLTLGGDAYNWSLIMSLGFIIYNSATIAILISVVPGILCLAVIYKICKNLKISRNWSLFACTLFYSLPNTIWQSKNDEKTDFALLFITLCCVLLFTGNVFSKTIKKPEGKLSKLFNYKPEFLIWAICGLLIGFTFGIKYVAMLSIFAFLVVIFYTNAGKFGAIAIFFLNFVIIFGLNLTRFAAFENSKAPIRVIVPLIFSFIAVIIAMKKNKVGLILALKKSSIFFLAIAFTFLPWAIKHFTENKSFSIDKILTGKSPLPALYSDLSNIKSSNLNTRPALRHIMPSSATVNPTFAGFLNTASAQDKNEKNGLQTVNNKSSDSNNIDNNRKRKSSANEEKEEEIRRYLGYERGIIRFISLPYDIVMKSNVMLGSSDTGILLLILLPMFVFVFTMKQLPWNILKYIFLLFILMVSIMSVQYINGYTDSNTFSDFIRKNSFTKTPLFHDIFFPAYFFLKQILLNTGSLLKSVYMVLTTQSLGVCFMLIALFSVPAYFLYKGTLYGLGNISKTLIAFVFCILQYWMLLSSGIIWYGIVGFSLVPVIIALLATRDQQEKEKNSFMKRYVTICAVIWFILILPFQFMPTQFLYETDSSKLNFKEFIAPQFVRYAIGEDDEKEVFKKAFSPIHQNIIRTLNTDRKSRVLNVSTFLNYYISDNDSRVYKDNQLGIFNLLYANAKNDRTLLAQEFKKNKIKYILVSLNTAKIDKTPDKSLTKKFDELMIAMINNPDFHLLFTNRIVERPDGDMEMNKNGVPTKVKYDVVGISIVEQGTDALFEIL